MLVKSDKPIAIVLGGTNPHKALIDKLKSRGYYTVLVDYLDEPPAKKSADVHIKESTLDTEKVLAIALEIKADLVIATCVDQANIVACYVAEKLNLPSPYSFETAKCIGNKVTMKRRMKRAGIPTSEFIEIDNLDNLKLDILRFPLVVKPSDTNGSKGVRKSDNVEELNGYLNEALKLSRNGIAIVEEFVQGDEIGVDCFIINGEAHIITMHKKRKPLANDETVIYSIGSISPPGISTFVEKRILEIANKIANEFNLINSPLLMQLIVNDMNVNVIEFAPRIGGGLNFRKIELFAGFDILSASIDSYYNRPAELNKCNIEFLYSENHIYVESGVFGRIEGIEILIENGTIVEFYQNKVKGMKVISGNASKDRIGSFIVKGGDIEEVKKKIAEVYSSIKIYSEDSKLMEYSCDYRNLLLN